jgi:hypothetical protein
MVIYRQLGYFLKWISDLVKKMPLLYPERGLGKNNPFKAIAEYYR